MDNTLVSESKLLVNSAVEAILEKKGNDVLSINLTKLDNAVCDYFIVCDGSSTTQVAAIADYVSLLVRKEHSEYPIHAEGLQIGNWALLDYGNVVVHIFLKEKRQFYNLEALWADGIIEQIENEN